MTNFITGKPNGQEGVLPFSKLMFSKIQVFLVDMMLFFNVSDLEGCAFSIFDLSLTQLA